LRICFSFKFYKDSQKISLQSKRRARRPALWEPARSRPHRLLRTRLLPSLQAAQGFIFIVAGPELGGVRGRHPLAQFPALAHGEIPLVGGIPHV